MPASYEATDTRLESIEERLGEAFEFLNPSAPTPQNVVPPPALAKAEQEQEQLDLQEESDEEETEQAPEERPEPTEEDQWNELPDEEEPEEESEEAEAEGEETQPEGEQEITTFEELAEALEVQPEEFASHLKVKLGEEHVPLSEVVERAAQNPLPVQMAEILTNASQQIEQAEQQRSQQYAEMQASILGSLNAMLNHIQTSSDFGDEAMTRLRQEDPERWATKIEERHQFEESFKQSIAAARQFEAQRQQQQAELLQQRAAAEGFKLIAKIPEWRDNERAMKEANEISETIQTKYGFTPEELAQMPDHRLALIFRDAHRYHRSQAGTEEKKQTLTRKRVRARKSLLPTSSRRATGDPDANRLAAARRRQRETANDPARTLEHQASTVALLGEMF